MMRAALVIPLKDCCELCNVHAKVARRKLNVLMISGTDLAYKNLLENFEIGQTVQQDYMDRSDHEVAATTIALPDTESLFTNVRRRFRG
jgi:hypothetical protein